MRVQKEIEGFDFYSEWAIINTILQNLIKYSIKYSCIDRQAVVKIVVKNENDFVAISVEDNGQGIPLNHQANIFNMFYRANDRAQGTGLGLYILKRAVERLNGTIELSSTPNEGSDFLVKLPMV